MNAASQGDKALSTSDTLSAIQHFTQALVELPRAPAYYIKRSTAYSRVKAADGGPKSSASLRDAEIALTLARERGKRELILSAQMRRGVALYQLERFGDAGFVFEMIQEKTSGGSGGNDKEEEVRDAMGAGGAAKKNGYEQELPIWVAKVKGRLNKLGEGNEKGVVSVKEYPSDVRIPTEKELKAQLEALKAGKTETEESVSGVGQKSDDAAKTDKNGAASASSTSTPSAAPVPEKVRHEWYQSNDSVVVTLYVKGIAKDSVAIELKEDSVSLQFPLPSGTDYDFTLDPLFTTIDPANSKVSVMSTKIDITLRKRTPGQKWNALEASAADVKLADRQAAADSKPTTGKGPSYPTSSRHGAKDWDKLASSLDKKPKSKKEDKEAGKDESGNESDGAESVDSDFGGGDAVDGFFKKLYANADPDTRRAMVKSYVESQGTSLSTNWGEVGKGKVEAKPPSD
ncbi:co-chaperone SGT1 [Aspergillus chevalieri]|uniref:SGT1 and CS domain protein n=1 Tax=Aspergillus chevalieri TaxID=182096 RepID=A0A7R7VVG4_ASPCH|nr:uncharacterized protein ACHE_60780A [Aspergillus chevalieri]BCR90894.1 hypothetical protein ACHE_60780A [Aspergillus chevalieri]